jgi:hypothetical protein
MGNQTLDLQIANMALRLRVLVLALGETSNWWRTQYLTGPGLRILARVYKRTAFGAAVQAATAAACDLHEASIGRGRSYHLFRLPSAYERDIRSLLAGSHGADLAEEIHPALGDSAALLDRLQAIAAPTPDASVGPWCVGTDTSLCQPDTFRRIAGAYVHAFQHGEKIFPYMEADPS